MARLTQITHEHHTDTGIISRLDSLAHDFLCKIASRFLWNFSESYLALKMVWWCWPNHQPCWVTAFFTATVS